MTILVDKNQILIRLTYGLVAGVPTTDVNTGSINLDGVKIASVRSISLTVLVVVVAITSWII